MSGLIFVNVPFSVYRLYILDLLSQPGIFVNVPFSVYTLYTLDLLSQLGFFVTLSFSGHILLIYCHTLVYL